MKKTVNIIICYFIFAAVIVAQSKAPTISFEKTTHDFGTIKEADGPASYKFKFTNTGMEAIILKDVRASCGCTTPSWTKEPILPGHTGEITVIYNPINRPGSFTKTITVTSNCTPPTTKLTIKGMVEQKPKTVADNYPYDMGNFRLANKHLSYMKLWAGSSRTNIIKLINTSDKELVLSFPNAPKHLSFKTIPPKIAPQQEGRIIVNYDSKFIDSWGFVTDYVSVAENGKVIPKEKIAITANIEEDFSKLTIEQKANAPIVYVENPLFDLGTINTGEKKTHLFQIKNAGKTTLVIRQIKPTCNCVSYDIDKMEVPAGKTAELKVTFDAAHQKGKQNKMISIITNAPIQPKLNLIVKGDVISQ